MKFVAGCLALGMAAGTGAFAQTVASGDAASMIYPPKAAEVELLPEGLLVRVQGGKAPFTWLANGVPVAVSLTASEVMLASLGRGFITLSVIDAEGRSARSQVRLR